MIIQLRTVYHTMFTYGMYKWGNQIGTYLRPIYGGRNIHFFKFLDSVHTSDAFMKAAVITCACNNDLMEVGRFPKIYTQNTLISNWTSAYFTYFMRIGISISSKNETVNNISKWQPVAVVNWIVCFSNEKMAMQISIQRIFVKLMMYFYDWILIRIYIFKTKFCNVMKRIWRKVQHFFFI